MNSCILELNLKSSGHGCSGAERIQEFSGTKPNDVLLDVVLTDVGSALTPSFVHAWRAISGAFATPANYFKQPGCHIAVHVCRGDVTVGQKSIADDHVYIHVARTVQAMLPKAHVHILSTTFSHITNLTTYHASHFDIYKKHGFQVHLDNPEIDDLTHFAQADVLICSQSAFSFVPSILNAKCSLRPRGPSRCLPTQTMIKTPVGWVI